LLLQLLLLAEKEREKGVQRQAALRMSRPPR
jgi:hypothetical protein